MIKDCSLCFEDSIFSKKLSCNHRFCLKCINEWNSIKLNCPMCRKTVNKTFYIKLYNMFIA